MASVSVCVLKADAVFYREGGAEAVRCLALRVEKFMESIKKSADFQLVYNHRRSVANRLLVLYVRENGLSYSRLGISVSRKVGKAVKRNRVRRLIKEQVRINEALFKPGYDLVTVVRAAVPDDVSFRQIERSLFDLLGRQKVIE